MTKAVLFDRDGTLVVDVAGNRNPDRVELLPGAREAVDRLRSAGYAIGVITNQPGVSNDPLHAEAVRHIHRRIESLLGPLDGWFVCGHASLERCACRKPKPGLIVEAAAAFEVLARECVVIGDIGSDVDAARAAGARAILVPTAATLPEEIAGAPATAANLRAAADLVTSGAV